jgi:beta-lactamase superfamily II metal-dependent hydrolase
MIEQIMRVCLFLLATIFLLTGCLEAQEASISKSAQPPQMGGQLPESGTKESTPPLEASLPPSNRSPRNLTVHFIDVGQGDSIFIQLPHDKEILIDGGSKKEGGKVVEYLASQGVDDLEVVVSTSPDADHLGGLLYVLQNFRVAELVDSGQSHTTQTYSEYKTLLKKLNLSARSVRHGYNLSIDPSVSIVVLAPPDPLFSGTRSDTNSNSVVLLVDYNNTELLLAGDAEAVTEEYLMMTPQDIDILKVAHHGSRYSSTWSFLAAFSPEIGIISAGCSNPYGHPHRETLDRLRILGVKIFTTCSNGNIIVTTDGRSYAVIAGGGTN